MNDDYIEYAYIFFKCKDLNGNNIYRVVALVKGFYDENNKVFIGNGYKEYKHIFYSSKFGFALREKVPFDQSISYYDKMFVHNHSLISNNLFYLDDSQEEIQLMWLVGDEAKKCNDVDLKSYMIENKKIKKRVNK